MEIYKLNASLNWDSYEDTHPWDLDYATFDVSMRLYPTHSIQLPINFIQLDKKIGYSIGAEYFYDLYQTSHQNSHFLYNDDDVEEMQREQEEEYNQYTSFYNATFQQENHQSSETGPHSTQHNDHSDFNTSRDREFYQYKIYEEKNEKTSSNENESLNHHSVLKKHYLNQFLKKLFNFLDMKYIYGILKCHLHRPYPTQTHSKTQLYLIIMNYLSCIFGKYKFSTNFGYHMKMKDLITKIMLRRKFYIPYLERQLYLSASVMNFHNLEKLLYGVSASIKGYSLQVRSNALDLWSYLNISLTKRGLLWSPFTQSSQSLFLQKWKEHYENQQVFSTVELPPPPKIDSELYPELRILDDKTSRFNNMHTIIVVMNKFRNVLVQISKILRYLIDLQVATAETTLKGLFSSPNNDKTSSNRVAVKSIYHYISSKFYEQLYLFSVGLRSRWSIEYCTEEEPLENGQDENITAVKRAPKQHKTIRIPIELDWGCEWFRLWCFVDLVIIDIDEFVKYWWNRLLNLKNTARTAHSLSDIWRFSTITFCVTLLDVYTLFSKTWQLAQLLGKKTAVP
ncbi:hypothetical protein C9374_004934 [Naegleria lovaniensis]|uniref:Uncharacterized protein n=1 Tax=Naegleria lovaniensis TaxID=51637 RepID=A0AA88KJ68_NAELO|nr:uncharacterized protein C9374_004934 [Naegleria lovaniensis]KAG2382967.1 hypothetical protein C9374_004934 [Naegleria lovaniensis]